MACTYLNKKYHRALVFVIPILFLFYGLQYIGSIPSNSLTAERQGFQELLSVGGSRRLAALTDVPEVKVGNFTCRLLFDDSQLKERMIARSFQKYRNISSSLTASQIVARTDNCDKFTAERGYLMRPVSEEEEEFPIAFTIVLYKEPGRAERLLRAIYRPQNYYCLHVDIKSPPEVHLAMKKLADCFPNVFIASRTYNVTWAFFSVLDPEIRCMKDLWRYKKWKYFINLTGQEFPLKTNLDLVKILKIYNGANDIPGVSLKRLRPRFMNWIYYSHHPDIPMPNRTRKQGFLLSLNITKGSVHIAASRAFISFLLHNPISAALGRWFNDTFVPDETYFSTLQHNYRLRAPGGYLGGASMAAFTVNRYKIWRHVGECRGKFLRNICTLSVGDLPFLAKSRNLFANKFEELYHPLAYDCLEELHFNRTKADIFGLRKIDKTFYENLPFVLYSRRDIKESTQWTLSDQELDAWRKETIREEEEQERKFRMNEVSRPPQFLGDGEL